MAKEIKGIIIVDKPKGKTSPEITKEIKNSLEEKTGHCGALDPFATGVLPILIGKAVKIQEYLQKKDKEYLVTVQSPNNNEKLIKKALKKLQGKIKQTPPKKSAVKREERTRRIYNIDYIKKQEEEYLFKVHCQHGTYIRNLVKDISRITGKKTELKELRRTKVGEWSIKDTEEWVEIKKKLEKYKKNGIKPLSIVKPLKKAISQYPTVEVKETAVSSITHGENLKAPGIRRTTGNIEKGQTILIETSKEVIAIGKALYSKKELENREQGTVIKTNKVIKIPG